MDFLAEFYNAIVKFILDILNFFGLNTDRVPDMIPTEENEGE